MTQLPLDLPPTKDDLLGLTTCGWCNTVFPYEKRIIGIIRMPGVTHEDHFCCLKCSEQWEENRVYVPVKDHE
jgi:hypothetical protein